MVEVAVEVAVGDGSGGVGVGLQRFMGCYVVILGKSAGASKQMRAPRAGVTSGLKI